MLNHQRYQFDDEEWGLVHGACEKFARAELETTKNQRFRRNQYNLEKMMMDNIVGKIGEWAVCFQCWKEGYNCSEPDMEIYTSSGKSFDADLILEGQDMHVKSQSVESAERYGTSWTFQKGGRGYGHTDPIISEGGGYGIFTVVDIRNKCVDIYGPLTTEEVRDKLRDPKLERLKATKTCLYLEDFKILEL